MTIQNDIGQPLFVIGPPRSGTTLVQRLLNSYDDILIWGEHEGVLSFIADAFFCGMESKNFLKPCQPSEQMQNKIATHAWPAWLTWLDESQWDDCFRQFLSSLFSPMDFQDKRIWGFKEIRYGSNKKDRALDLLHALYPHSIFVFVVRSSFNTLASSRIAFPTNCSDEQLLKNKCKEWQQHVETLLQWYRNPQYHSYLIKYEDLIEEGGEFLSLLHYLGKTLGHIQKQMLRPVASPVGSSFLEDTGFNSRWKTLPLSWLHIIDEYTGKLNDALGLARPPALALSTAAITTHAAQH
ncbi:hypothetical protein COU80_04585 [Candidatus Peregrinibacteria bacterium CG10_big_fil_rev_8_21_14_0_10_55_24]|nr:MAG: hypothetical protein COU80_04585 [Candidatus Peregrinibacteria bacterium CG10_big_fil_rev_8_21_14_0_10_55_24]